MRFLATSSGVPPALEISSTTVCVSGGTRLPRSATYLAMASLRALADFRPVQIHARHPGLRREGNELRVVLRQFASAQPVLLLRQNDDRAALRRLVGNRSQLRGVGQIRFGHARGRVKIGRLAIAQRDRSGLVEQQNVHVARGFDGAAGHGDHVALNHAVHAGDADGRQQPADGRGNQADQQGNQHENILRRARNRSRRAATSPRPAGR